MSDEAPMENEGQDPVQEPVQGLDPAIANQMSLMALSNAISQQQLNSAAMRSQMMNAANALTLGVQLAFISALQKLIKPDAFTAAVFDQLVSAARPAQMATLQTVSRTP